MKQGIEMYVRALVHLLSNFWAVLAVTGPAWVLLSVATSVAAFFIVGDATSANSSSEESAVQLPKDFWRYFLIAQILNLLTLGYIGPKFHRSTLPENTSDVRLPFAGYVFALMKLAMIGIVFAIIASRIVSFLAPTIPGPLGELTIPVLFLTIILYALLQFALILPALAMARPRDLGEAWRAMRPFRLPSFASLILLMLTFAILHSAPLVWDFGTWGSLIVGSAASWFALMVLLSYLNVVYRDAHKFENRMKRQV